MNPNYYITIMAGGIGSRFWPSSTADNPKQFLDILGVGKSLIRMTFERFLPIVPAERMYIVTNAQYKDLVKQHLPEIPERNILCEPSRNNTGPCVAYTALRLLAENKNAVFVTAPSDHIILKEDAFRALLLKAFDFAERQEKIVTLGIEPTRPDTGYGYIEQDSENQIDGINAVKQFREKPDLETAKQYMQQGNYLWNAGIFIWKADQLIESFETYAKDIMDVLSEKKELFNTAQEQEYINEVYPKTPSISVDYAILEKSPDVYTIPADIGWSDLGTWNSLHAYTENDENNNLIHGHQIELSDTRNSIIRSGTDKIIVVKGLDNYIVVDEQNALLIYPKSDEQEIKEVVKNLS